MDDPSLHPEPPLTEQGDGLGKDMPLRLLHHPALETKWTVAPVSFTP